MCLFYNIAIPQDIYHILQSIFNIIQCQYLWILVKIKYSAHSTAHVLWYCYIVIKFKDMNKQEDIIMNNVLYYIWLAEGLSAGNPKGAKIISDFGSAKEFFEMGHDEIKALPILTAAERDALVQSAPEDFQYVIDKCRQMNVRIVTIHDDEFPDKFRDIPAPPIALYVAGDISGLDEGFNIAVVGTRKASAYSLRTAGNLSYELAKAGAVIISGCAVGIDRMAHTGALQAKGRTVAFIGTGHDRDYPAGSMSFKREIVNAGGAVISEYPPESKVSGHNFPVRNRLMAAIASGVLVVEAPAKSGALITASIAEELGREVLCVPPADIYDARYDGVKPLIRGGATAVMAAGDVWDAFEIV